MNCFFFLDLQGLLFKIGCYFLLSQRMFGICWLLIPALLFQTFGISPAENQPALHGDAAEAPLMSRGHVQAERAEFPCWL